MKRIISLITLGLAITLSAHADATGTWIGWGEWTFQGSGADCNMTIGYRESETEFRRLGGTFDCGIVALHSDPLTWTRQGNQLFLNGEAAGEVSENGFFTKEAYGDGVHVETKFTREGLHADYQERWVNEQGVEIYLITGRLFLRQRP